MAQPRTSTLDFKHNPAISQGGCIQGQGQTLLLADQAGDNPAQERSKTARHIQVTTVHSTFMCCIQIPLAQALEDRPFFLYQSLGEETH